MMKQDSKIEQLLVDLLAGKSISGLESMKWYGLYRLSAAVHRLKGRGWNVVTDMVNVDGERFARYRIPRNRQRMD